MGKNARPEYVSPHVMVRHCGLSEHGLDDLATRRTAAFIDEILDLERQCHRVRDETCDILFDAVRGLDDRNLRRRLLRLRRDIHNDRTPAVTLSNEEADELDRRVGGTRAKLVRQWVEQRLRRDRLTAAGPDMLAAELRQARQRLRELARHDALRRGLLFATTSLAAEADRYAADPEAGTSRRTRKTELGLVRYLSRAACKPTPFSSFATVRLGSWTRGGAAPAATPADVPTAVPIDGPRRLVRLNLALVGAWLDGIAAHPDLRPHLPVAVNPVCWRGGGAIRFLARRGGNDVRLRGVHEAVVTVPVTPALEWIMRAVRSTPELTVSRLRHALAGRGAHPDTAAGYVDKLIDLGLLECRTGALGPDPLSGLADLLEGIDTPTSRELRPLLADLATAVAGVAASSGADAAGRGFDRVRQLVDAIFDLVPGGGGRAWQDNLLYEDHVSLDDSLTGLTARTGALADLHRFLDLAPLFDKNVYYRESLKHFLRTRHPGGEVAVLPLFEEFARAVRRAGMPEMARGIPVFNPFRLERLERFHDLQTRFQAELRVRVARGAPEINLDAELLAEFAEAIPDFAQRRRTYSCFVQPASLAGGGGLVLNDVLAGPARTAARFLTASDDGHPVGRRLLRSLRECIAADAYGEGTPAELHASFGFNANLHPLLTDHAVDYQTRGAPPGAEVIPLRDLSLRVDGEDIVVTAGSSGRRIALVDLSMMAPFLLPPLYRFLTQVRHTHFLMLKRGSWLDDDADGADRRPAASYPRIRCGDLVLTRREWRLAADGLPVRERNEPDFEHYLRVRRWLREAALPERAYVRSQQIIGALRTRPAEPGPVRGDVTKPQYVDFASYLFVRLFERMCRDVAEYLSVEEALPAPRDPEATVDSRVIEYVTEVTHD